MRSLAITALVLLIIGGTAAAFAVTERLKLEPFPITAPRFTDRFSPTCRCAASVASLSVRVRRSGPVDAAVVDSRGAVIRTLAEGRQVRSGRVAFSWDGRDAAGEIVPDGSYRLRVHLDNGGSTVVIPTTITVDTQPPTVRLVRVRPLLMSPDGDERRDRIRVAYLASERSGPMLLVDGAVAPEERVRRPKSYVVWKGDLDGRQAPAGAYRVAVRVRDEAGNVSAPSPSVVVRIRYVELTRSRYRVTRARVLRFRTRSDALRVRWTLERRRGGAAIAAGIVRGGTPVRVRLPRGLQRGRYTLRVTANGHSDAAPVVVPRRRRR